MDFYMTVGPNDINGRRQEAYMLVPLAARDAEPPFWEWPHAFTRNQAGFLEHLISLDDGFGYYDTRFYDVPERSEFRFCTQLHRLGEAYAGHILKVTHAASSTYSATIISPHDAEWVKALQHAREITQSQTKLWGYSA